MPQLPPQGQGVSPKEQLAYLSQVCHFEYKVPHLFFCGWGKITQSSSLVLVSFIHPFMKSSLSPTNSRFRKNVNLKSFVFRFWDSPSATLTSQRRGSTSPLCPCPLTHPRFNLTIVIIIIMIVLVIVILTTLPRCPMVQEQLLKEATTTQHTPL